MQRSQTPVSSEESIVVGDIEDEVGEYTSDISYVRSYLHYVYKRRKWPHSMQRRSSGRSLGHVREWQTLTHTLLQSSISGMWHVPVEGMFCDTEYQHL